jgi:hypothetical protein
VLSEPDWCRFADRAVLADVAIPVTSTPVLVGREAELATARRLLDASKVGEGGLLLVTGEAGIGKSRLLAEVAALAEVVLVAARAWAATPSPPMCWKSSRPHLPLDGASWPRACCGGDG